MTNKSKNLIQNIKQKKDSALLENFVSLVEKQLKEANTSDEIIHCVVDTLNESLKVKPKHDKKYKYRNALIAYDLYELIHDHGLTKKKATRRIAKIWFPKQLKNNDKHSDIISLIEKITENKTKLVKRLREDRQLYAEYKDKYWQSIHPTPFLVDGYIELISEEYFNFMGDDIKHLH